MSSRPPLPRICVILLNWNGWKDTLECLSSLAKLDYHNFEVTVVDNGSTDGSEERIREAFPDVTVLQTKTNLGFAGGNNVGLEHAFARGADYVWMLNNDTVVDPAALEALVGHALSDESVGMVGSKIYYYDPPDLIWFAGGTVNRWTGRTQHLGIQQKDRGGKEEPHDVDYVTACSMLVSLKTVEDIGPMDTRFFLYYEETDWATQAKLAGWRVSYQPHSKVWHKVSRSAKLDSPTMVYHFARSSLLFARKHISSRPLLPLLATLRYQVLPFLVRGKLAAARAGLRGARAGLKEP